VLAHKGEFCIPVVEGQGWQPRFRPVASLALNGDRTLVPIRVARDTLGSQPQECLMGIRNEDLADVCILDVPGIVAILAFSRDVRTGERKARPRVVKLGFIELRDLRICPKVFLVTRNARSRSVRKMESVAAVDLILYFDVARETLCSGYFLSAFVTLCAVGNPFENGMNSRKWTRRYLREGILRNTKQNNCRTENNSSHNEDQKIQRYPSQMPTPMWTARVMNMITENGRWIACQ
jgi:hypothetical protein